ncbi:MAG: diaminopimelate decarboxylase [Verrucomicrobiales bacterium]|nr:diaminopimelate decarboxylase [Verrucomicrobiales bacterium]
MSSLSPQRADQLREIASEYGTPTYVYDAEVIRKQFRRLKKFDIVRFAQKACSNTHILRLLREEGAVVDCVSAGELDRALAAGFEPGADPAQIVFTADIITPDAIERVVELGVPVNAGSPDMLTQIGEANPGHPVWLRINPGFGHGHSKKTNTGGESSKHGIWHENIHEALELIDKYNLKLVGIHMHIGSGAEIDHLSRVCDAMVEQVKTAGRDIEAISGGGGLSIPYSPNDPEVDVDAYFDKWDEARRHVEEIVGHKVHLELEPGRFLAAQAGSLIAEVRGQKQTGSNRYVLVDAGFNDLMRPVMYGSRHEMELLPHDGRDMDAPTPTVVAGPLCESGDIFTQLPGGDVDARPLPPTETGDLLVFKDAGAYGSVMASNYNSRPLAAEVMIDGDDIRLIRRRQTIEDLLALEEV